MHQADSWFNLLTARKPSRAIIDWFLRRVNRLKNLLGQNRKRRALEISIIYVPSDDLVIFGQLGSQRGLGNLDKGKHSCREQRSRLLPLGVNAGLPTAFGKHLFEIGLSVVCAMLRLPIARYRAAAGHDCSPDIHPDAF